MEKSTKIKSIGLPCNYCESPDSLRENFSFLEVEGISCFHMGFYILFIILF